MNDIGIRLYEIYSKYHKNDICKGEKREPKYKGGTNKENIRYLIEDIENRIYDEDTYYESAYATCSIYPCRVGFLLIWLHVLKSYESDKVTFKELIEISEIMSDYPDYYDGYNIRNTYSYQLNY